MPVFGLPTVPSSAGDLIRLVRLLQFSDSTLPVGSFSFSNGLESAIQLEIVTDAASLRDFAALTLRQAARMDGVAGLHAHRAALAGDHEALLAADHALWTRRVGQEQQMMLARMGRKFAELAVSIADLPKLGLWLEAVRSGATPGCFPIGQAVALVEMGADEAAAFAVHHYSVAAMALGAAPRLMRIDHIATQRILFEAMAGVEEEYRAAREVGLADMSSFAPVFDILVAHHAGAHVRLFMN